MASGEIKEMELCFRSAARPERNPWSLKSPFDFDQEREEGTCIVYNKIALQAEY